MQALLQGPMSTYLKQGPTHLWLDLMDQAKGVLQIGPIPQEGQVAFQEEAFNPVSWSNRDSQLIPDNFWKEIFWLSGIRWEFPVLTPFPKDNMSKKILLYALFILGLKPALAQETTSPDSIKKAKYDYLILSTKAQNAFTFLGRDFGQNIPLLSNDLMYIRIRPVIFP